MANPPAYMTSGFLYVVDEEGREIPASRRSLSGVTSRDDYAAIWRELESAMGEGCRVEWGGR